MVEIQNKINTETDTEMVYVEGWKGKDEIEIYEGQQQGIRYFKIVEHRKNKETGEISEDLHTINKDDVVFLWNIIEKNCDYGDVYAYKYLVRKLIEAKEIHILEDIKIEVMMEAFNGGKNRAKYYFPLLYYPLKVLEAKGYIQYFGRGGISRLEEGELK